MSQLVSQLLSIGGRSLEREEDWLRSDAERKGQHGGILTIDEICFCQYVFVRAILPEFDSTLEFTREGRRVAELGVKYERKHYFFILDHWKDEPVLPLQDHVDRLARQKPETYLLVFSANPLRRNRGKNAPGRRARGRRAESGHASIWRPDRKRRGQRVLGRGLARSEAPGGRPGVKAAPPQSGRTH